jgi:hypothetical protein
MKLNIFAVSYCRGPHSINVSSGDMEGAEDWLKIGEIEVDLPVLPTTAEINAMFAQRRRETLEVERAKLDRKIAELDPADVQGRIETNAREAA